MESVINPSVFYWADALTGLKILSVIIAVALFFPVLVMIIGKIIDGEYSCPVFKNKTFLVLVILAIILLLVAIFVPGKETILEMAAAKIVTRNNLSIGKDALIDIIKQIAEAFKGGN